jgi:hypothetical protein
LRRSFSAFILLLAVLAADAVTSAPGPLGRMKHRGEILGVNRQERTVTVRSELPEGKELHVFYVGDETIIRRKRSKERNLSIGDLAPGDTVWVTARREPGRKVAVEIVVKPREDRGAP